MFRTFAAIFLVVSAAVPCYSQPHANPLVTATLSGTAVRYAGFGEVREMQVQVFNEAGEKVFESPLQLGNLLDYSLANDNGAPLGDGQYVFVVAIHDFSGRTFDKFGTFTLSQSHVTLGNGAVESLLPAQLAAMRNRPLQPIDRVGVDVPSVLQPSVPMVAPSSGSGVIGIPRSDVSGTGTANAITKWIDAAGTLGDSAITENAGLVAIGTPAAAGGLRIFGPPTADVFAGMGNNIAAGPAMNFGYSGTTFGRGSGFFNVRPDASATPPNPSLRFLTLNQQRMIITNTGQVGIGITSPTGRLDVRGSQPPAVAAGPGAGGESGLVAFGGQGGNTTAAGNVGGIGGAVKLVGGGGGDAPAGYGGAGGDVILQPGAQGSSSLPTLVQNGFVRIAPDFGNVFIGTSTAPPAGIDNGFKLLVQTPGNAGIRVEPFTAGGPAISVGSLGNLELDAPFIPGGRFEVLESGNVGVGIPAPLHKLDVNGDMNLPATTSATTGVYNINALPYLHGFGRDNVWVGDAGNFTMCQVIECGGNGNVGVGKAALKFNGNGQFNVAVGIGASRDNASGFNNVAVGQGALVLNTGNTNIGIGAIAGQNLTTGSNNIDIGNVGVAAESNVIRIGTQGTQTKAFMAGISGVTTGAAAVAVVVDANGQLGTTSSSRRYKFDIADMGAMTDDLMRLRPVRFRYLAHGENAPVNYGLIAEEVADVYPELVARNKDGEVETVMYQFLAPMLLNEVQKQHRLIDAMQKRIDSLERELAVH